MSVSSPQRASEPDRPKIIHHAGRRWEVLPGGAETVRARADWSFEALRHEFGDVLLRDKPTRVVFSMDAEPGKVAVKALVFDEFNVRLRSIFGRCRTRKEWENHRAALRYGIPTVMPLALGELRKPLLVHQAVMITKWRDGTVALTEWRRKNIDRAGNDEALELAADIARITALTQESGLYHNEIRPDNLLIETTDNGPKLLLIDWKHARIKPRTAENDLQNVQRTAALFDRQLPFAPPTEAEKEAFLAAYLEATAHRPDRARLVTELRKPCPQADAPRRADRKAVT